MVAPWKPSEFHAPAGVSGKQFSRIPPEVLSWRDTAFSFGGITVSVLVLTMTRSLSGINDTEGTDVGETAIDEQSITSVTLGAEFVSYSAFAQRKNFFVPLVWIVSDGPEIAV